MIKPRIALSTDLNKTTMRTSVVLAIALLLSACSHKPLKAPCDLNEGKPAVMIGAVLSAFLPESLVVFMADDGPCGPLRRLGQN